MLVQVQIRASVFQALQISELFPLLVESNLEKILIFGALVFIFGALVLLFIAGTGDISGKLNPGKKERMAVGGAGTILFVIGLLILGAGILPPNGGGPNGTPTPTVDTPDDTNEDTPDDTPTTSPESQNLDEDCVTLDPANVEIEQLDSDRWLLVDGDHQLVAFDERENAQKARNIIQDYGFDRHCFVGQPDPSMRYWLVDGQPPSTDDATIQNEDCVTLDPANVEIEQLDSDRWLLVDGDHRLVAFDERENAQKARNIIQDYGFDRHCFVGRPDPPMDYWLSTGE